MSPDVKVYQAYVEIDDVRQSSLKLKPGLSAVCTIYTETQAENVLAVPVAGDRARGSEAASPAFSADAHGPENRTASAQGRALNGRQIRRNQERRERRATRSS